jgi:hypothetical protein
VTVASFLNSGASHAILNGLAFFAFVLWLCLGFWTYKDAKRRMQDPLLIGLSVLLALAIPFVGPFVYMLFRPPEYLEDVRERELEIKAIEERISAGDLRCPVCTTKLKQACASCGAPLEPIWQICPYCEMAIEPAAPGTPPALGTRRAPRGSRR